MEEREERIALSAAPQAGQIHLRLFGLQSPSDSNIRTMSLPFSANLTVAQLWEELQQMARPDSPLARLSRDKVLALVNGMPIQRLNEWETRLKPDDTVTFMAKAFGG